MTEERKSILITITGVCQKSRCLGCFEKVALDLYCEIVWYFLRVTEISLTGSVKHPGLQQTECLETCTTTLDYVQLHI